MGVCVGSYRARARVNAKLYSTPKKWMAKIKLSSSRRVRALKRTYGAPSRSSAVQIVRAVRVSRSARRRSNVRRSVRARNRIEAVVLYENAMKKLSL